MESKVIDFSFALKARQKDVKNKKAKEMILGIRQKYKELLRLKEIVSDAKTSLEINSRRQEIAQCRLNAQRKELRKLLLEK